MLELCRADKGHAEATEEEEEDALESVARELGVGAATGRSPVNRRPEVKLLERGKHELESDFRRFWEEFRSSSYEKEKECRLVKQQYSVAQLVTKLVEAHVFAFDIGGDFVTDVEKLRIHSKGRSLHVNDVIAFFSEITELGICPGSNLLYAVEDLVIEQTNVPTRSGTEWFSHKIQQKIDELESAGGTGSGTLTV